MDELATKILIAVIASGVGAVCAPFFSKVAFPWLIEFFRDTPKLKPHFEGVLDWQDVGRHRIALHVSSLGFNVKGTLRFLNGVHQGKEYVVTGVFRDKVLTFCYRAKDKGSTSQGTGTFESLNDGNRLVGFFAFYSQTDNRVDVSPCEFKMV